MANNVILNYRLRMAIQTATGVMKYSEIAEARSVCSGIFDTNAFCRHNSFHITTSVNYSENIGVERYLSPVSGRSATIILPLFSGRFASCVAA